MMATEGKSIANRSVDHVLDIQRLLNKSEHAIRLHGCSDIVIQANLSDITHTWITPISCAISSSDFSN